jgi:DNA-binding CsgD family transcriptional regulator
MTELNALTGQVLTWSNPLEQECEPSEFLGQFPSAELESFRLLPFEVQIIQDLEVDKIYVLKGSEFIEDLSGCSVACFYKSILKEDLGHVKRVEKVMLERLRTTALEDLEGISLNITFRMFFAHGGLKKVTRNSFVYGYQLTGRPRFVYHMIKDITGRQSCDEVRFKLTCPGEDNNSNLSKTKGICFTPRESEILEWLVQGFTSERIAKRLFISAETVNKHRKNMIRKANVSDTRRLVAIYLESKNL